MVAWLFARSSYLFDCMFTLGVFACSFVWSFCPLRFVLTHSALHSRHGDKILGVRIGSFWALGKRVCKSAYLFLCSLFPPRVRFAWCFGSVRTWCPWTLYWTRTTSSSEAGWKAVIRRKPTRTGEVSSIFGWLLAVAETNRSALGNGRVSSTFS